MCVYKRNCDKDVYGCMQSYREVVATIILHVFLQSEVALIFQLKSHWNFEKFNEL